MKLHFDGNQPYQLEAVAAVTRLFEGQLMTDNDFMLPSGGNQSLYTENGLGNHLTISEEQIRENVLAVQKINEIKVDTNEFQGMHFSVEMETGTGKTYVYIRTIYELNRLYGFKKFVIVVPTVAIRESVKKNLDITHEHFQGIYDRQPVNFDMYDSKKIQQLRNFASSNTIQILIINIDSFAKDDNIINRPNDNTQGKIPIEFIQNCRPIVIVDEPQKVETSIRKKAIDNLHPLCTLRYSATHTVKYNLVYSLNPVRAYDLGLVKQIAVDSVLSFNAMNEAYVKLEKIKATKTKITAQLLIDINTDKGAARKSVMVKSGDDLYALSNEREIYRNGFIISEIDASSSSIYFTNGTQLQDGSTQGGMDDEVKRYMIQRTIEEHLKKELKFKARGIKVLTLFFIDRVKNYKEYDDNGNTPDGKYARWFEEIFTQKIMEPAYSGLYGHLGQPGELASRIHGGYFSADNKGRYKDTNGETQADDSLYKLIMQKKEELLDQNTPLRFIFSHTALQEGWDNPNVFQICTLNETRSELKKRQEIGRGLRLAVNQQGLRVTDREVNKLTIIANESYEDFAKALQQEIEEDCGVSFSGRIINNKNVKQATYRQSFEFDKRFLEIWNKIKFKTTYRVSYDTAHLINHAAQAIAAMPETKRPLIQSTKKDLLFTTDGIDSQLVSDSGDDRYYFKYHIPNILSYIQDKTELTRSTIFEILKKSNRIKELFINPQLFMDNAVMAIKAAVRILMVDGIQYEKIGNEYALTLFDDQNMEIVFNDFTFPVTEPGKTINNDFIPLDSALEKRFAKDCETSENIDFYIKLPNWFKINTPVGTYNPDWGIVYKGAVKMIFVAETKSAGQELKESESLKIACGKAHFDKLDEVHYNRVSAVTELTALAGTA